MTYLLEQFFKNVKVLRVMKESSEDFGKFYEWICAESILRKIDGSKSPKGSFLQRERFLLPDTYI